MSKFPGTMLLSFAIITTRLELIDDKVQISVKDNRVGMTQEVWAKLLNPFFTAKPVV